jgi:hypothetical protein
MIKIINPELTRIVNEEPPGQYSSRSGSPNLKAHVIRAVELGQDPANEGEAGVRSKLRKRSRGGYLTSEADHKTTDHGPRTMGPENARPWRFPLEVRGSRVWQAAARGATVMN